MKNYHESLTGLRTIAATMVFFHHFNPFQYGILYNFVSEFHIGVTIFFVLSGFLIGYRYIGKKIDYRRYFVNRFARIYPVFFIFTLLTYIIYPTSDKLELFLNLSLLKSFFLDYKNTGIEQGWTLTVEECFYGFALILFFLVRKRKIFTIVIMPFILLLLGLVVVNLLGPMNFHGFLVKNDLLFNYTFLGRSFEFISGFLLAYFLPKLNLKAPVFTYIGILGIISSLFLLINFKYTHTFGIQSYPGKIVNNYFLPIVGVLPLILGLITEKTWVSKLLSSKLFETLGKSSYVFYIIHMGVIQIFISKFVESYLLLFIIMQVLSFIIYRFFEEPANRFLKNLYKNNKEILVYPDSKNI